MVCHKIPTGCPTEVRTAWGIPQAKFAELGTCQKSCGFLAWEFAGRAAFIAVQVENDGKKGPCGGRVM
ncbi:MAG: hypothetical protein LBB83_05310 [Treponema sp.]|jgi:hypothetical protein|nr:hypothetical protein [Treponema sp.]